MDLQWHLTLPGNIPHDGGMIHSNAAQLLKLVPVYCAATGLAEATISTKLFNDGKRIETVRSGGDLGAEKATRAIEWLSNHWPADAIWPHDVPRPDPQEAAA